MRAQVFMRARPVYEQNFERHGDPKKSLGLGLFPKDPMPVFNDAVQELRLNPQEVRLNDFINICRKTAEDLVVIAIRDGLIREFGQPTKVIGPEEEKPGGAGFYDPAIKMTLASGHDILITPSGSRIHWTVSLYDGYKLIRDAGSGSTFGTIVKRIKKLMKLI